MSQQYVVLKKKNDLLNSLIGQSYNQKSKFEAEKIISEIHSEAQQRAVGKNALCYILEKDEIKGVGGSTLIEEKKTGKILSNLILNNFGNVFALMHTQVRFLPLNLVNATDIGGVVRPMTVAQTTISYNFEAVGGDTGSNLQVGSGSTTPAGSDFNIETAFGSAPENAFFFSGTPVFNPGTGQFQNTGSIVAGGAGTVNECGMFMNWRTSNQGIQDFMIFHDLISPGQAFIATQQIALTYTMQL